MAIATGISAVAGLVISFPLFKEAFDSETGEHHSGAEGLIGARGRVLEPPSEQEPVGWVLVKGERWKARCSAPLAAQSAIRVDAVAGLELVVSPLAESMASARASRKGRTRPLSWSLGFGLWATSLAVAFAAGGSLVGAFVGCPLVVVLLVLSFGGFE